jgi:hypothetical protein
MGMSVTTTNELIADFGPYQLVIRPSGEEYGAVLWRTCTGAPAEKLMSASGPTLDKAKAAVERQFYEEMLKRATTPDAATYARAFSFLWPKLTHNQREMIQAQYRAPDRTLSTRELATVVGWKSHSPVNLWYGLAGFALFGEVPREITQRNEDGGPVYSFALSTGERTGNESAVWQWTLRPEVAEGLQLAGCV